MPLQPRHGYAAGIHHDLPTGDINRSRSSPPKRDGRVRVATQPWSVRFELLDLLRGVQPLVPHVRLSVLLAGPTPSDSAGASRRCQGCFDPPRCPPGPAALSFNQLAATSQRRCPLTTAGFKNASWRSMSVTHNSLGPAAAEPAIDEICGGGQVGDLAVSVPAGQPGEVVAAHDQLHGAARHLQAPPVNQLGVDASGPVGAPRGPVDLCDDLQHRMMHRAR